MARRLVVEVDEFVRFLRRLPDDLAATPAEEQGADLVCATRARLAKEFVAMLRACAEEINARTEAAVRAQHEKEGSWEIEKLS